MKIRNGFVSNSSSSSFIVVFDKSELSVDYLKEKLYYSATAVPYVHNWRDENIKFDTDVLCQYILDALEPANTQGTIRKQFEGMSNYDDARFPDYPGWNGEIEDRKLAWDEYEIQQKNVVDELTTEFMESLSENDHVFVCEFGDDTQIGSQLEHGDTFAEVRSIKINHH